MIRNYLKVAIRSIFRNKLTAFINIAGLALAMTCAVLICLYVADELSYDKYHAKSDRIFRITRDFLSQDGSTNLRLGNVAPPIGPLARHEFGEIEVLARTINYGFVISLEENGELKKSMVENNLFAAEPDIFKIFDFKIKSGNPEHSLERPFTIMLSEKTAIKYFGDINVIGKRLRAGDRYDLEVTGVYEGLPPQSHWHPELLISFSTLEDSTVYGKKGLETNWGNNAFGTYFVLAEGADPANLEAKMPAFLDKYFGPYAIARFGAPANFIASKVTKLHVQKVTDIHLKSHQDDEVEANGNINNVYLMSVIGVFILLIACFNFINLSTARATKRAKEVGLRKVVGAFKGQLVGQYLSESVLTAVFALLLALAMVYPALGWLNQFTGKNLTLVAAQQGPVGMYLLAFAVVVGLLAGIYPAFVISGFKPALVLKGQTGSAQGKGTLRKSLVVAQFAISIVLIIATVITTRQLSFLNAAKLGYTKDQVVVLPFYNELDKNYESFYHELTSNAVIGEVALSSRIPTGRLLDSYGNASVMIGDSLTASGVNLKSISVNGEFFKTYDISFYAGRNFSKQIRSDDSLGFVINEAAAKQIGWKKPEDRINTDFAYAGVTGKLIGIVRDFHFESLHQAIVPMIFLVRRDNYNNISVKIAGQNVQQGLAYLEKVWKEFAPKRPFDYQFVSQNYQRLYDNEQRQNQLFTIFSSLAILIACLGLFGLATFNTLQRVKEIGIRKVLGASVSNILGLLSTEIVILILVANLCAWPAAWWLMSQWLGTFAYHIDMNFLFFALAGLAALLVALLTVSAQTIKAAVRNPSNTLRYE